MTMSGIQTLPHSPETEDGFLSCLLQFPDLFPQFVQGVGSALFYSPPNQILFNHLCRMSCEGEPITIPTIQERLFKSGDSEKIGGPSRLIALFSENLLPNHAEPFRKTLYNLWIAREGIKKLSEAIVEGQGRPDDPSAWLMAVSEQLQGIGEQGIRKHKTTKELVHSAIDRYDDASVNKGKLRGISTGFAGIDAVTGGLQQGHFWTIGGGTSDGKSALLEQIILTVALAGHPTALYTLEMTDDETIDRFFCQHSGISSNSFLLGTFQQQDLKRLMETSKALQQMPMYIRDVSEIKLSALLADMRLLHKIHKIKVFAIDYGQLIQSDEKSHSREREVAMISSALKSFSKKTRTTVIYLSQLNEEGKLRESRAPSFDSDKGLRIRVPYKDDSEDGEYDDTKRIIHIDKNRGGERYVKFSYHFHGPTFTFSQEQRVVPVVNQQDAKLKKSFKRFQK